MKRIAVPQNEAQLEELLSEPTPAVIEAFRRLAGDVILLGAAGKMGPTLARMARRAANLAGTPRRIIAVSRFSAGDDALLAAHGIETVRCDLLDERQLAELPEAPHVIFMTGRKFGSTGDEAGTWAMNCFLPGTVCRRYRHSRIVAFSTGNVYGLVPSASGGSRETDVPQPVGEYAMSCLGRERVFAYFSRSEHIPLAILRLNYACELRYGVLVDLAGQVWREEPIDLAMGHFNILWQGDANAWALAALSHTQSPPWVVNLAGPELLSVRAVCQEFGRRMDKTVRFVGEEAPDALLSNSSQAQALWGPPRVPAEQLIEWVADWTMRGGRTLGKPTHFASRDGKF